MGTEDDRSWIADTVGGVVTRFDRTTAGRSRATWLVDVRRPDGTTRELVLRRDTGDGPLSGTELSLSREAAVYAALSGTGVRVPRLEGIAADGDALLVERVAGTEDLGGLDAAGRDSVLADFIDAVADLHLVDVGSLDLPGLARPLADRDHALADLSLWRRIFDDHVTSPAPLLRFAFGWLSENAPSGVERTVLCHGDLGPGNFLHAGGRVTALLDWEFAHLGDPMDDLAWLSVRGTQVAGLETLAPLVGRWVERTGLTVDADRVAYYQVFVLVRMAVACLVGLARRTGAMDASTYFALLPLLERQITTALARLEGVPMPAVEPPTASPSTGRAEVIETISSDLGGVYAPELESEAARSRLMGTFLLLSHLAAAERYGSDVDSGERSDLAGLLGRPPGSVEEGRRALVDLLGGPRAPGSKELIHHFSRQADRQLALWPAVAAHAARPLLDVSPA